MQLSDFFATFNLFNLFIFLISFVTFDAMGVNIAYLIKPNNYLRLIFWLWGLGLFVFFWFILHFFLPFWPQYAWVSLIVCLIFSLPLYVRQKGPVTFIKELIYFPYPLFFILIAAKPLFFLLSAPPFYTDEMAYHFYSPAQLMTEIRWQFISSGPPSLYHMVPKMLETSFILMFSLTRTYVTARLLHFLLVFFSLYAIAIYIRRNIGLLPAIIYSFLSLVMSASTFLTASTWGYVDAGASVFAILFMITIIDLLKNPGKKNALVFALLLGLAVGIKYTSLAFIGSAITVGTVLYVINYRKKMLKAVKDVKKASIKTSSKFIFIFSLLFVVFGGYWYVKNYIISGNPIYPFVFSCKNSWPCGTGRGFFQAWAMAIDLEHFPVIKSIIFQKSDLLFYTTLLSFVVGFFIGQISKNIVIKFISVVIFFAIILEIILSKNITGFELRYYYHWVLCIPLLLILPFGLSSRQKNIPKIALCLIIFYLGLFTYSAGNVSLNNIKRIYEPDFVPGYIRNYAMHRINLNDWIDYYFPKMNNIIKWCGEKRPMQNISVFDPSLIWFSYEGMMRVFMINCRINNGAAGEKILIVSETPCTHGQPYPTYNKDSGIQEMHKINQEYVCNGKEIRNYLYEYDRVINSLHKDL